VVTTATVFSWLYHAFRWTWHDPDGYNFISGPLADVTLLGGCYALLRHHNCHAKGCWRIGRHPVEGTAYVVCRKHYPHKQPTAEQIHAAHAAHQQAVAGARAAAAAAVHDVKRAAHDVASDVHEVAQDAHEVAEAMKEAASEQGGQVPPTDLAGGASPGQR
jgi:hypothetical protein